MEKQLQITPKVSNKSTCVWTIVLWLAAVLVTAVELLGLHRLVGVGNLQVWKTYISPFAQIVKDNFLNLFISQISTTFLVTAFLSLLGDKDSAIYWTSAMDYKLVHPKGSSLKDFTWYSMCTLAISFLAALFQARLCFVLSFLINICFLGIITWRMIIAFYSRDGVKNELKTLFAQATKEQQREYITEMAEKMIRAAHDHNIEFLQECKEFFDDFITDADIQQLRRDEQEVRTLVLAVDEIVKDCKSYLKSESVSLTMGNELGLLISEDGRQFMLRLQAKLTELYQKAQMELPKSVESLGKVPGFTESTNIDEVQKQLTEISERMDELSWSAENPLWIRYLIEKTKKIDDSIIQTDTLRFLDIVPPQFPELNFRWIQSICQGIGLSDLIEDDENNRKKQLELRLKNGISHSRMTYSYPLLVASTIRKRILYVLRTNTENLPDGISTWGWAMLRAIDLESLVDYFNQEAKWNMNETSKEVLDFSGFFAEPIDLLTKAYQSHQSLNASAKAIIDLCELIKSGIRHVYSMNCAEKGLPLDSKLPEEISKRVRFFTKEDVSSLLTMTCSKNALLSNMTDAHGLLTYLCEYAPKDDESLVEEIAKTITDATWLGPDREYILTYL